MAIALYLPLYSLNYSALPQIYAIASQYDGEMRGWRGGASWTSQLFLPSQSNWAEITAIVSFYFVNIVNNFNLIFGWLRITEYIFVIPVSPVTLRKILIISIEIPYSFPCYAAERKLVRKTRRSVLRSSISG